MLVSVFTPTHDPAYLMDAYRSLQTQTCQNFEWVVLTNGKLQPQNLPEPILSDERVIIRHSELSGIGALKRAACQLARGDVFLELDHDDELLPEAVEKTLDHISDGADMVYSDSLRFRSDGQTVELFDRRFGWEYYPTRINDQPCSVAQAFPLTPRSLCEIYYAPDHLRAWTRAAYEELGGHDATMAVADDHDLLCRTYIAGKRMDYLGGCYYRYRLHAKNTCYGEANRPIQQASAALREKYLQRLIIEWCRRQCYVVASVHDAAVDYEAMPSTPLPWREGSVGALVVERWLEFCPNARVVDFFNRVYDVLAPGGYLLLRVPDSESVSGFIDPRYQSSHSRLSLLFYTERSFAARNPAIRCRYQLVSCRTRREYGGEQMLTATLSALRNQRQPGLAHI